MEIETLLPSGATRLCARLSEPVRDSAPLQACVGGWAVAEACAVSARLELGDLEGGLSERLLRAEEPLGWRKRPREELERDPGSDPAWNLPSACVDETGGGVAGWTCAGWPCVAFRIESILSMRPPRTAGAASSAELPRDRETDRERLHRPEPERRPERLRERLRVSGARWGSSPSVGSRRRSSSLGSALSASMVPRTDESKA